MLGQSKSKFVPRCLSCQSLILLGRHDRMVHVPHRDPSLKPSGSSSRHELKQNEEEFQDQIAQNVI